MTSYAIQNPAPRGLHDPPLPGGPIRTPSPMNPVPDPAPNPDPRPSPPVYVRL